MGGLCAQVLAALFVLVPFCYLSGSFTINPVAEAASQARHLQLLSGCPPLIYWAGFYVSPVTCTLNYFSLSDPHMPFCNGHLSDVPLGRVGCLHSQTDTLLQRGSVK